MKPKIEGHILCGNCHKDTVRVLGDVTKYWWCDYCEKAVDVIEGQPVGIEFEGEIVTIGSVPVIGEGRLR